MAPRPATKARAPDRSVNASSQRKTVKRARPAWDVDRLKVSAAVWGEGEIDPAAARILPPLLPTLGLDPAMTVLEIGSGLGGLSRKMHLASGVYTLGFEADPYLLEMAEKSAIRWGLRRKTRFAPLNLRKPVFEGVRPRSIDCIVMNSTITRVASVAELLRNVSEVLCPGGRLLLADYFETEEQGDVRALRKWIGLQSGASYLMTASDFKEALYLAGFEVHVDSNLTVSFRQYVRKSWEDFLKGAAEGRYPLEELGPALLESTRWMAATRALKVGGLEFRRMSATLRRR